MSGIFEHETLRFQEASRTTDSGGRTSSSWSTTLTKKGRVRVASVATFSEIEGTVQVAEYTVYVRGTPNIHHKMRIKWGDKYLKIIDTINKYGSHLEIKCALKEDDESFTTTSTTSTTTA